MNRAVQILLFSVCPSVWTNFEYIFFIFALQVMRWFHIANFTVTKYFYGFWSTGSPHLTLKMFWGKVTLCEDHIRQISKNWVLKKSPNMISKWIPCLKWFFTIRHYHVRSGIHREIMLSQFFQIETQNHVRRISC